ncbi:MAG: factor-independent urate hydroxylase [Acidobacteriota bacterium]
MDTRRVGRLVDHRYGKVGVRLLRLDRSRAPHQLFEATVDVSLEGDFGEAYAEGDNRRVVPTDTMKNTVHALARERAFETAEGFARLLARHFVNRHGQVGQATVTISERPWSRHGDADAAFIASGEERRTAEVRLDVSGGTDVRSGVEGLLLLKSSDSGFSGFPRDPYTVLEDTDDRILSTSLEARWDFSGLRVDGAAPDFADVRRRVRRALLDAFAGHTSRSVQHTLYWMGEAALGAAPEIERIVLRMPNRHYILADLGAFELDNPNVIFVPTDEPAGLIEGTVERARGCG